jgi:gluconate 2-dehydrogenase alpha chain
MGRTHDKVDIVTVGGGFTAAILASKILPGTSHRMVSLEQGPPQWTYPDFAHNHDSLRFEKRFAMMHDISRNTWTWRPNANAPSLPLRQYGFMHPGQGLGGAIVHWSGQLWRFLETDFNYRTHHIERYGADRLPAGMSVQDWPVDYHALEPYYDAFEYDFGVSGQAGNIKGELIEGGNPFEAPRQRDFPLPPLAVNAYADLFAAAASGLGMQPFPQPAGILSQGWIDPFGNVRSGCLYCGFCTRFGCEVDAKSSSQTTYLPVALNTGRYEVRTGATVIGIETADNGEATGVRYVNARGEEHFQPADVVILSAFVMENVRMLLLSRGGAHPDGIGNDRGQVGRNYTYQVFLQPARGLWEDRDFQFYMGNTSTVNFVYEYTGDNFDHSDLDFIGGSQIYSEPCERSPVASISDHFDGFVDRQWGAEWKQRLSRWDGVGGVNIQGESPAYEFNFMDLDPNYRDSFGRPLLRITFDWTDNERALYRFIAGRAAEIMRAMNPDEMQVEDELGDFRIDDYQSTHPNGGAIMGTSPGNSVTNSYGQVWDTPNVFVTGAALFPQNPNANPSATVAALAYRTAEALRDRYFDAPGEILT